MDELHDRLSGSTPKLTRHHPLRIFLASPSDVTEERDLARGIIERLREEYPMREQIKLECISWDQPGANVPLEANLTPQAAITKGLPRPSKCDLVVTIFWSRMGTPLPESWETKSDGTPYRSGTEWEFLDALRAARENRCPTLWVYRRTEVPSVELDDSDREEKEHQFDNLNAFFKRFRDKDGAIIGGVNTYVTASDFGRDFEMHLRNWLHEHVEALKKATESTTETELWVGEPYPGLRAFTSEEGAIFFGRRSETAELLDLLKDPTRRFIAVIGASGSGKSSLVAAGVLPSLRENVIPGSGLWRELSFKPGEMGDDPFLALAAKIVQLLVNRDWRAKELAEQLARAPSFITTIADQLVENSTQSELLLFIDQFEELFSACAPRYQRSFIALLTEAAHKPRVRVLVTMRADFYSNCLDWPELVDLIQNGTYPLGPPSVFAMLEMIRGPAQKAGLALDQRLEERMLTDVGEEPGRLALLAFTLRELYKAKSQAKRLTIAGYESFGGAHGAIGAQAERTMRKLSKKGIDGEAALPTVFLELVEIDPVNDKATRKRADRSLFEKSPQALALADALTDARLLVNDRGILEVAHEALFIHWRILRKWIKHTVRDLRLLRQLERAVKEWERQKYRHSYLWPNTRAKEAVDALKRLQRPVGENEAAFLYPVQRLKYLVTRDARTWEHAERNTKLLWTYEEFAGFSDIKAPAPEELSPNEQEFILQSFNTQMEVLFDEPKKRATIGDVLGWVGDPRFGPDRWFRRKERMLGFVEIPAGRFQMGSDRDKDRSAYPYEGPQHPVELPAFFIARYLVTVAQFQAFVTASGYKMQESDYANGAANHPVVWVSWHDAQAYGRWLQERLRELASDHEADATVGQPDAEWIWQGLVEGTLGVGLPSEAEWEKAARGIDGRIFPWGDKHDPRRANDKDACIDSTSAVGCFPQGGSPFSCHDMSGNVWEWTRSLWGKHFNDPGYSYPYDPEDGRENLEASEDARRVLRGGAFNHRPSLVRCASRYFSLDPDFRAGNVGFRVVVSPFFSNR